MAFPEMKPNPTMAPFNDSLLGFARDLALYRPMVTRGFFLILAFLRIGAGFRCSSPDSASWRGSAARRRSIRSSRSGAAPANGFVASYLAFVSHHTGLFARLVVLARSGSARS